MNCVSFVVAACGLAAVANAYNANREPLGAWGGVGGGVGGGGGGWGGGGAYYRPDTFAVDVSSNYLQQPSQNLFWDKFGLANSFQGSNQVGGGLWGTISQKFPFLNGIFSRMELPGAYGPPAAQYPQYPQYFYPVRQFFSPPGVQVTDDAVVVSAPGAAAAAPGYDYPRPQYRLDLPQKASLK